MVKAYRGQGRPEASAMPSTRDGVGRYYDPPSGQFITVDPLVDLTGQPYGYVAGDPVNLVDPLGLIDECHDPRQYQLIDARVGIGSGLIGIGAGTTTPSSNLFGAGSGLRFNNAKDDEDEVVEEDIQKETEEVEDQPGVTQDDEDEIIEREIEELTGTNPGHPNGPELSEREATAIVNRANGRPFDRADYNSAAQKLKAGEKYGKSRRSRPGKDEV